MATKILYCRCTRISVQVSAKLLQENPYILAIRDNKVISVEPALGPKCAPPAAIEAAVI